MTSSVTGQVITVISALMIALTSSSTNAETQPDKSTYAQRNDYPTEVCANQVARRFNLPWTEVDVRQDRYVDDGAVLVNWRTSRDSGYCEVSARGDLLRLVIESDSGAGYRTSNPLRICADEVARQRNVTLDSIEVEKRQQDGQRRTTVAWRSQTERGYCEVSASGRVEYFKVTQIESDSRDRYSNAERVCRDAVAEKRKGTRQDIRVSSAGFSGKRLRVDWRTQYESGYCELDRKDKLRDFQIVRQDKPQNRPQNRAYRKQEKTCTQFVADRLNLAQDRVAIVASQSVAGTGSETVRIDWQAGRQDGYCLIRRGSIIGSSLR